MSRAALRAFVRLGLPASLREEAETIERVTTRRIEREHVVDLGLAWRIAFDQLRDAIVADARRSFRAASAERLRRKALEKAIAAALRKGLAWMVGQTNDRATRQLIVDDARQALEDEFGENG